MDTHTNEANEACPWGKDGVMSPHSMVIGGLVMSCQRENLRYSVMDRRLRRYQ